MTRRLDVIVPLAALAASLFLAYRWLRVAKFDAI
jgi:hypothetical protein